MGLNDLRRSAANVQNDLKVFCGKKNEIVELEEAGKIVPNKWYLAWDSGEFFVASQSAKLIQYGYKKNIVTEEKVKEIANACIDIKLITITAQLQNISATVVELNQKVLSLENKISELIQSTVFYAEGNKILDLFDKHTKGVYIAISNSTNSAILKGHTYYSAGGGTYEDITV